MGNLFGHEWNNDEDRGQLEGGGGVQRSARWLCRCGL
jgi:hypothetical protein